MGKVYSKHFVDSVMTKQKAAEQKAYLKDSIIIQEHLTKHKLKGEAITGEYIL